ncbi:glycine--tRNA ligase subunit alpha [Candidatus Vidania fulgoroideorum]
MNLCEIINKLSYFWKKHGVNQMLPSDIEIGAATFSKDLFFNLIKDKKINYFYAQKSRRPNDIFEFKNIQKNYIHTQFQVVIKKFNKKIISNYIRSLHYIGISKKKNIINFKRDNWKNISIGAFGKGWEVNINFLEVSQITFLKKIGGKKISNTLEITYGLERLLSIINCSNTIFKNKINKNCIKYNFFMNDYYLIIIFILTKMYMFKCLQKKLFYISFNYFLKIINIYNFINSNFYILRYEDKIFLYFFQKYSYFFSNFFL